MVPGLTQITDSIVVLQSDGSVVVWLFFGAIILFTLFALLMGNSTHEPPKEETGFQYEEYAPSGFLEPYWQALEDRLAGNRVYYEYDGPNTCKIYLTETDHELCRIVVDENGHVSIKVTNGTGELSEVETVTHENFPDISSSDLARRTGNRIESRINDILTPPTR
jgi:hypothetical protein